MALEDRSGRVDRSQPKLLSEQVSDDLRERILSGPATWRIPSELDLANQYGVSRITVRSAVSTLRKEGMVKVVHGRGAWAVRPNP